MHIFNTCRADFEASVARGIYPEGIKTLSVESLQRKLWNLGVNIDNPEAKKQKKKGQPLSIIIQESESGTNSSVEFDQESQVMLSIIVDFLREYANAIKYVNERKEIYRITKDYIRGKYTNPETGVRLKNPIIGLHARIKSKFKPSSDILTLTGLAFIDMPDRLGIRTAGSTSETYSGPSFQIQNLRLVNRLGPDGNQINHVVFSLVQRSGIVFQKGQMHRHYVPAEDENQEALLNQDDEVSFQLRGGCTLIFDLDHLTLRYAISKPLLNMDLLKSNGQVEVDKKRAKRQYEYQYGDNTNGISEYALYFGGKVHQLGEPFSFLHQH